MNRISLHACPPNPSAHSHAYESAPTAPRVLESTHKPPLWQGADKHSSTSVAHVGPEYPARQRHSNTPGATRFHARDSRHRPLRAHLRGRHGVMFP